MRTTSRLSASPAPLCNTNVAALTSPTLDRSGRPSRGPRTIARERRGPMRPSRRSRPAERLGRPRERSGAFTPMPSSATRGSRHAFAWRGGDPQKSRAHRRVAGRVLDQVGEHLVDLGVSRRRQREVPRDVDLHAHRWAKRAAEAAGCTRDEIRVRRDRLTLWLVARRLDACSTSRQVWS